MRSWVTDENVPVEYPMDEAFLDLDQAVEYAELAQDTEEWPGTEYTIKTLKLGDKEFERPKRAPGTK